MLICKSVIFRPVVLKKIDETLKFQFITFSNIFTRHTKALKTRKIITYLQLDWRPYKKRILRIKILSKLSKLIFTEILH